MEAVLVFVLVPVGVVVLFVIPLMGLVNMGEHWYWARFALSVGQVVAILGCIGSVVGGIVGSIYVLALEPSRDGQIQGAGWRVASALTFVAGVIGFWVCAAWFVVFTWVKRRLGPGF